MIASLCRAGTILLLLAGAARADEVKAVSTPGEGNLTMCPVTFATMRSCNLYHHIKLPARIAVGDRVTVHFGSNPKQYPFPVARIVHSGDRCTIYSQTSDTEDVEKIEIEPCGNAPAG
jgi:hypothetical protein